jgi:hypothetical protein
MLPERFFLFGKRRAKGYIAPQNDVDMKGKMK